MARGKKSRKIYISIFCVKQFGFSRRSAFTNDDHLYRINVLRNALLLGTLSVGRFLHVVPSFI